MLDRAQIDRRLIASLREHSRPLRPEASLIQPSTPPEGENEDNGEQAKRVTAVVAAHTLFLSTSEGYAVVERHGPPPLPGDEVELGGHVYRAQRYRHSPFPADPRPCVVLEAGVPS